MERNYVCKNCGKRYPGENRFCSPECQIKSRCNVVGDCWVWFGPVQKTTRQGLIFAEDRAWHVPTYVAHLAGLTRKSHEMHSTSCGNRLCCNPAHATITVSTRNSHKLTAAQAVKIYQSSGRVTELARAYGVSTSAITRIRLGHTWGHATGAPAPIKNKKD